MRGDPLCRAHVGDVFAVDIATRICLQICAVRAVDRGTVHSKESRAGFGRLDCASALFSEDLSK